MPGPRSGRALGRPGAAHRAALSRSAQAARRRAPQRIRAPQRARSTAARDRHPPQLHLEMVQVPSLREHVMRGAPADTGRVVLTELYERIQFLDLRKEDTELLAALKPALARNADEIVSVFYRNLLAFAETRDLLVDPEVTIRLLDLQKRYLLSLAPPSLDPAYVDERLRIGQTHFRIGLSPRWYLGAYSLYFRLILPLIAEVFRGQPAQQERAAAALNKVLMLDAQLEMESYIGRREAQLHYQNDQLADQGRQLERVYQEQRDELRRTSARAQAAEELASIATVMTGLAHEIGTPMSVIQGHAELLESAVADDRGRARLQTIREQIDRISHIIRTLLNLARPHEPYRTRVELGRVIEQTLSFLGETLERQQVVAKLQPCKDSAVLGDAEKLQQLFINLFLNAIDAMDRGGLLLVHVVRLPESVEVRVTDTGHGIPEDILGKIFDPFFTTKDAGRGSGLGLMVSRAIVRDHAGRIDVRSRVGEGTEFRLEFPAVP
jgi:signal transduction histidine kinase